MSHTWCKQSTGQWEEAPVIIKERTTSAKSLSLLPANWNSSSYVLHSIIPEQHETFEQETRRKSTGRMSIKLHYILDSNEM